MRSYVENLYAGSIVPGAGIYRLELDIEDGTLVNCGLVAPLQSASWVIHHTTHVGDVYYAAVESNDFIQAFRSEEDGSLRELASCPSGGEAPCHLCVHPEGRWLAVSNYRDGSLMFIELNEDGTFGERKQLYTFDGHGPNPGRQTKSHLHSVTFAPDGKFALACDLGTDRIYSFVWNEVEGAWNPNADFSVTQSASGAGPRHLVFSPDGTRVYVINELSCTLDAFAWNRLNGSLTLLTSIPTLPPGFRGFNKAASIDISKDGRFLYVTNRGADLITILELDPEPVDASIMQAGVVVTPVQYLPGGGVFPRFAALDSSGKFYLVANKKSQNVTVFRVNPVTGKLTEVCKTELPWCTCITR